MLYICEYSTCMVIQSLSCSLVGLGEPVDCGVTTCGGLWTAMLLTMNRDTDSLPFINSTFLLKQTMAKKINTRCRKTSKVPQCTERNSLLCKWFLHLTVPFNPPNPQTKQNIAKKKSMQTNCIITCLYSSHTQAVPPAGSSPTPPAGQRRCCPVALSDSPCGSRLRSAPPAQPRSLMRKQYNQQNL